ARVDVDPEDAIARLGHLHAEGQADVAEPDDADDGAALLHLVLEDLRVVGAHAATAIGRPDCLSEALAASSTRTTRTPSWASLRGAISPRATLTKCPSSWASGSAFLTRGIRMSPSRIWSASPNE